jgi:hypothetical protein
MQRSEFQQGARQEITFRVFRTRGESHVGWSESDQKPKSRRLKAMSALARTADIARRDPPTDGPGFATDEPMATLGEKLALPPFLEPRRATIEAGLKPLG